MGWNLDDDRPSRKVISNDRKKEFNITQRAVVKVVGENMASLGCILIAVLFVGYIWTDMRVQLFTERMICDVIISAMFFIAAESLMRQNGVECGKIYDDYIVARREYYALRDKVLEIGTSLMGAFCEEQIETEYKAYMKKKCRDIGIDYDKYIEKYSKMPSYELRYHVRNPLKRGDIKALSKIKHIELTPDMLLKLDEGDRDRRGGVGVSGRMYMHNKKKGAANVVVTLITCAISASFAFVANDGASWGLVMFTLMKLALLCWRMFKGYTEGSKAYNTVEVSHIGDKSLYLEMYLEYAKNIKELPCEAEENKPA